MVSYTEYHNMMAMRQNAISRAHQLRMIIRCNNHRPQRQEQAKQDLAALAIPPKPKAPVGYEITIDGDYAGFSGPSTRSAALELAQKIASPTSKIKLVAKECIAW